MEETLIDNVFTDEELVELSLIIQSRHDNEEERIEESLGRTLCQLRLSKRLEEKVTSYVESITNRKLKSTGVGYSVYSLKYGEPNLIPHVDRNETKFIFDYQYKANIEWPVYVEGKKYFLKDNQALLFSGKTKAHWRIKRKFNQNEYVEMIFFHFIDLEDEELSRHVTIEEEDIRATAVNDKWRDFYLSDIQEV